MVIAYPLFNIVFSIFQEYLKYLVYSVKYLTLTNAISWQICCVFIVAAPSIFNRWILEVIKHFSRNAKYFNTKILVPKPWKACSRKCINRSVIYCDVMHVRFLFFRTIYPHYSCPLWCMCVCIFTGWQHFFLNVFSLAIRSYWFPIKILMTHKAIK